MMNFRMCSEAKICLLLAACLVQQMSFAAEPRTAISRSFSFAVPVPNPQLHNHAFAATRLFVSRDSGTSWKIASTSQPEIQQIAIEAQEDGNYWFAFRHLTPQGTSYPNQPLAPQLNVLVDTTPPQLRVSTSSANTQSVTLHVDGYDMSLLPASLEVSILSADPTAKWEKVTVDPRQLVVEQGRLKTSVTIPLASLFDVKVRASIWDKVGHKSIAETRVGRPTVQHNRLDFTATHPHGINQGYVLDQSFPVAQAPVVMQPQRTTSSPALLPTNVQAAPLQHVPTAVAPASATTIPMTAVPQRTEAPAMPVATFVKTSAENHTPVPSVSIPEVRESDIDLLAKLVERQPNNVQLRQVFAESLMLHQDFPRAELQWNWIVSHDPQNSVARSELAKCLSAQNRLLEAQQILNQGHTTP